jgi:hypothetical protein
MTRIPAPWVQGPATRDVADRRFARAIDAEVCCSGRARCRPMKMIDMSCPSRRPSEPVDRAPYVGSEEVERLFSSPQAPRSPPAPDQPRPGDLSGLGDFVCDLSGPPAAVGVLDGGSLAGNDSSSSSSSLSSGFDCGLVGGDFRGSFIRRLHGAPRALIGLKLQGPLKVPEPSSVPPTIKSQRGCTILRATQAFQAFNLIFLQLQKYSHINIHSAARSVFFRKSRLFNNLRHPLLPGHWPSVVPRAAQRAIRYNCSGLRAFFSPHL